VAKEIKKKKRKEKKKKKKKGKEETTHNHKEKGQDHPQPQHDSDIEETPNVSTIDANCLEVLLQAMGFELPPPPKGYAQRYRCKQDYVNHLLKTHGQPPLDADTWKPQAYKDQLQFTGENEEVTRLTQGKEDIKLM